MITCDVATVYSGDHCGHSDHRSVQQEAMPAVAPPCIPGGTGCERRANQDGEAPRGVQHATCDGQRAHRKQRLRSPTELLRVSRCEQGA